MTADIKPIDNHWQQTTSEFREYLQQSIELLAHKRVIIRVEKPLPANPHKVESGKQTKLKPKVTLAKSVPPVSVIKELVASKLSVRHYSSPLWVGLGDENEGHSNTKTRRKKKTK